MLDQSGPSWKSKSFVALFLYNRIETLEFFDTASFSIHKREWGLCPPMGSISFYLLRFNRSNCSRRKKKTNKEKKDFLSSLYQIKQNICINATLSLLYTLSRFPLSLSLFHSVVIFYVPNRTTFSQGSLKRRENSTRVLQLHLIHRAHTSTCVQCVNLAHSIGAKVKRAGESLQSLCLFNMMLFFFYSWKNKYWRKYCQVIFWKYKVKVFTSKRVVIIKKTSS